jgi:hypothetical protein
MAELAEWDSFYVIVGSAAGALIGLQFVVMTLIAQNPPARAAEAGPVFSTPTIVHFSTVLLLSALLRVPWPGIAPAAISWAAVGLSGVVYALLTAWRARRQTAYRPDLEDYTFHFLLPLAAYGILTVAAFGTFHHVQGALFGIAGSALLLLFTAIHNAWDATAFHVFTLKKETTG